MDKIIWIKSLIDIVNRYCKSKALPDGLNNIECKVNKIDVDKLKSSSWPQKT